LGQNRYLDTDLTFSFAQQDAVSEVRQSAYALLGDLAISAFPRLAPFLAQLLPEVIEQIEPIVDPLKVSVCNNAAWAAGEIALQHGM
jgi:transportin-1